MQAHDVGGHHDAIKASAGLAVWPLAWTASLALARFGPAHLWDARAAVSWAAIVVNVAVGIGLIVAHARYLRGLDELQRKITLDALAVTLGVGWVGGFAYVVADTADLIGDDVNIGVFPALLGVVYISAIAGGHLRHR